MLRRFRGRKECEIMNCQKIRIDKMLNTNFACVFFSWDDHFQMYHIIALKMGNLKFSVLFILAWSASVIFFSSKIMLSILVVIVRGWHFDICFYFFLPKKPTKCNLSSKSSNTTHTYTHTRVYVTNLDEQSSWNRQLRAAAHKATNYKVRAAI